MKRIIYIYIDVTKCLIQNSKNARIQQVFKDVEFIHGRRQPPNILRQISNAVFITGSHRKEMVFFTAAVRNARFAAFTYRSVSLLVQEEESGM